MEIVFPLAQPGNCIRIEPIVPTAAWATDLAEAAWKIRKSRYMPLVTGFLAGRVE
jgi:hypothetical protein